MKTEVITKDAPAPAGAYSQGIVSNGFLFTAGFGPFDPVAGQLPEGIEAQSRQVLKNVETVLAVHGLDFSDVVKATIHLAGTLDDTLVENFVGFDKVYGEVVPAPYPARTTVGSVLFGILVEVDVVAALRE